MTERDGTWLNDKLRASQPSFEKSDSPSLPTLFVVGPPSSGTTLVSQLLAASGRLGYISNFVARFWQAPAVGASIEKALGLNSNAPQSSYRSSHGRTTGWSEPHEFGYFWDRWFDFGEPTHFLSEQTRARVERSRLAREVASLEDINGRPMCFKNNTWCTFQADLLADVFPKALFLVCQRDALYVAQSLFLTRRERFGTADTWWSIKPRRLNEIIALPPLEQVALQALEIERDLADTLGRVPSSRIIETTYSEVCADPSALLKRVFDHPSFAGTELAPAASPPGAFLSEDRPRLDSDDWHRLCDAIERHSQ